jgi:hypothetical protein
VVNRPRLLDSSPSHAKSVAPHRWRSTTLNLSPC